VYRENEQIWELVFGAKWNIIMQPVQIDQFGNANLSLVGDKTRPERVFTGSRGFPDNTVYCERVYYFVPEHTTRVFVDRVDFVSGVGCGPAREEIEIDTGTPALVFSDLGIFDFDKATGRMRVKSVHTGVELQEVIQNTGFELLLPDVVQVTESPTEDELRLIRDEIDPLGMRRLDFLKGEAYVRLAEEIRLERQSISRTEHQ
jgi:glutaconate CoA-transferase subunit B